MMQTAPHIWMDGQLVPWDNAQVHILTHTLHYGLAVFEGIRCYDCGDRGSAIFRLEEHIQRLFDSAHIYMMEIPFTKQQIMDACLELIRANGQKACYIRPLVYLGYGQMGVYAPQAPVKVAIATWPWGAYLGDDGLKKGIRVKVSSYARSHINATMSKGKVSGHYVNSILARREAVAGGYHEALLLDTEGYVAEGSGENIFMVRKGVIKTTPLPTVLDGITRDTALTLLRKAGYTVQEQRFARDELYLADEAFFTGTAAEVTPIREVDDRRIGDGTPGPVTRTLQDAFFRCVRGEDTSFDEWLTFI